MEAYPTTNHIRSIKFSSDKNNNKMERMNGEIREREKTMRGLKTKDTAILTGYQLFHNYIRPHMALDGKTPSEACGIQIEGKKQVDNSSKRIQEQCVLERVIYCFFYYA